MALKPTGIRQFRFCKVTDIDVPVELCVSVRLIDQVKRSRAAAPIHKGAVVTIGIVSNEHQVAGYGALRLGISRNFSKEAIMDICEIGRHGHTKTRRVGQEDAFLAVEGQSAADLVFKIKLSQIAAPNRALNFRYRYSMVA